MKRNHTLPLLLTCAMVILGVIDVHLGAAEPLAPGRLCGTLIGPDGKAVAGASVFLDDFDYDTGKYNPLVKTTTASDGTFHLGPLTPAYRSVWELRDKDLRVEAAGFAPQAVARGTFS